MSRINQKAFDILAREIETAAQKDNIAGEVAKKLAFQRLERLRSQTGSRITEEELKELFQDILPDFNKKVIKKAVKANRPPSKLWLIPYAGMGIAGLSGFIWLINLPYPMIRRPVARTAPILLLPSYLSMDHHYREAIAKVEQADQLVNQATSLADIELGEAKVAESQKHLDKLPVWFLGYQPQIYRTFFSFGWFFTLDEFKTARARVGRMEGKVFQEKNAMKQLETSEAAIKQAKAEYQQAKEESTKANAISNWQMGIDELTTIPTSTLGGKMAKKKLNAYRRDFKEVSGFVAGNYRTNTFMAAAQQFSSKAMSSCENPPHSVNRWQQCANLWQDAIRGLQRVPLKDPGYIDAQSLLATYKTNLGEVKIRQQAEADSVKAFDYAQSQIVNLPKQVNNNNREIAAREILQIIIKLKKVQSGTTVYQEAQELLSFANKKLQEIQN